LHHLLAPGIYTGKIRHRRLDPVEHHFEYSMFMVFLDIDRLPELLSISPWSGYNKWAMGAFHEKDHFGDPNLPLRQRLVLDAVKNGLTLPSGPVYLLTHLRYAGYCFNPISLYYCYEPGAETPAMVMAEVSNTFGETHNYWLPGLEGDSVQKRLHVSPFNTMDNQYKFRFSAPHETLAAHIENHHNGKKFFDATLTLEWSPWNASNLKRALLAFPLLTLKIIAAIHWQALMLFFKRAPFVPHPSKPKRA